MRKPTTARTAAAGKRSYAGRNRRRASLAVLDRHLVELIDAIRGLNERLRTGDALAPPAPAAPQTFAPDADQSNPVASEAAAAALNDAVAALPPRLRGVFERIAQGQSNREIAAACFKSPRTIETYRYLLRRHLKLKDTTNLAQQAWGYVQGMLMPRVAA